MKRLCFLLTFAPFAYAQSESVTLPSPALWLEPGYYEQFLENVQNITPEEVQAIAQQEMHPDQAVVLVVGNAELFDQPLEEFGEVVEIELQ